MGSSFQPSPDSRIPGSEANELDKSRLTFVGCFTSLARHGEVDAKTGNRGGTGSTVASKAGKLLADLVGHERAGSHRSQLIIVEPQFELCFEHISEGKGGFNNGTSDNSPVLDDSKVVIIDKREKLDTGVGYAE